MSTKFIGIKIASHKCTECLFSPDSLVDPHTMKRIVQDCDEEERHFLCHKHHDVMCKGYEEARPNCLTLAVTRALEILHGQSYRKYVDPDKRPKRNIHREIDL